MEITEGYSGKIYKKYVYSEGKFAYNVQKECGKICFNWQFDKKCIQDETKLKNYDSFGDYIRSIWRKGPLLFWDRVLSFYAIGQIYKVQ